MQHHIYMLTSVMLFYYYILFKKIVSQSTTPTWTLATVSRKHVHDWHTWLILKMYSDGEHF